MPKAIAEANRMPIDASSESRPAAPHDPDEQRDADRERGAGGDRADAQKHAQRHAAEGRVRDPVTDEGHPPQHHEGRERAADRAHEEPRREGAAHEPQREDPGHASSPGAARPP
jgi:hypothetical protein